MSAFSFPSLPLSEIVDVVVTISPTTPTTPTFNQGLIVGNSQRFLGGIRLKQYTSAQAMLADGFQLTDPEYIAATLYFSQQPAPLYLWVGIQITTAVNTIIVHSAAGGSGYAVGDTFLVNQFGGSGCLGVVTAIGGGGVVTAVAVGNFNGVLADGAGYHVAANLSTTTQSGSGAGLAVDITVIGETPLIAIQQCAIVNTQWYCCMSTTAVTADHEAIAAWIQGATPSRFYMFGTADTAVANNSPNNVFSVLKALSYTRVMGTFSTTQLGQFPNNAYVGAATMGVAMGLNTGLAGSYFTMMFKQLVGIAPEPLTQTQVTNITGNPGSSNGNCGNVYVTFAGTFQIFMQGWTPSGEFFDEILNVDMLSSDIQFSIMDLLISNNSVPQTDAGQTLLIDQVNGAAQRAVVRGYIGPGTWTGAPVLGLETGEALPAGYITQSPPYSTQAPAARAARQSMPIYLCLNEAGAAQSILIGVDVQR